MSHMYLGYFWTFILFHRSVYSCTNAMSFLVKKNTFFLQHLLWNIEDMPKGSKSGTKYKKELITVTAEALRASGPRQTHRNAAGPCGKGQR